MLKTEINLSKNNRRYYAFDGDRIGKRLQHLILQNDETEVETFAAAVSTAVSILEKSLRGLDCKIIFASGDSVLAFSDTPIEIENVQRIYGSITFSLGVGHTPREALIALGAAKLQPPGSIYKVVE